MYMVDIRNNYTNLALQKKPHIPGWGEVIFYQKRGFIEDSNKFICCSPTQQINLLLSFNSITQRDVLYKKGGFMFVIKEEVIRTRSCLNCIVKDPNVPNDSCRLCGSSSETIQHPIASCTKLAVITNKHCYDQFAKVLHQELAKRLHLLEEPCSPFYKHEPHVVVRSDNYKMYWGLTPLTKTVPFSRSDITLIYRTNNESAFLDIVIPLTHNPQVIELQKNKVVIRNWHLKSSNSGYCNDQGFIVTNTVINSSVSR
jgi:hypothetical protein